jgi:hypothetical protein
MFFVHNCCDRQHSGHADSKNNELLSASGSRKTLQTICAAGEQRALPLEPQRSRESIHGADI